MVRLENTAPPAEGARRPRRGSVRHVLRTAGSAALFWLVLSGHYEPLPLTLGACSIVVVCWLTRRAGLGHHAVTLPFVLRLPGYLLWLSVKVLVAAWAVVRKVWSPRQILRPVLEEAPASQLSELAQVIYANSITLTPGTLSLDVGEDRIEVHSLDLADIKELREGGMLARVPRTEARR